MRLFVAVAFPEQAQKELAKNVLPLRPFFARGRFSRWENYHLTLVFLGETDPARLPHVTAAMDECRFPPFSLTVGDLGRFRGRSGDVVFRHIAEDPILTALQADLTAALRRRGFPVEARDFHPHVTVAREAAVLPGKTLAGLSEALPTLTIPVGRITLMRSDRVDGMLTYTPIHHTAAR